MSHKCTPHWTRVISLVLLFVISLSITPNAFAQSASKPTGEGPFFLYPPGTSWYIGGLGYHTSCNVETDPACDWLKSWDYIVKKENTPMYLPFPGGTVIMSCQKFASEYWSGFLTPDERIVVIRSDDGRWEIGSLHVSTDEGCLPEGAHVDQMGIWAYVGNEGNSTTTHNHLWFKDVQQNRNIYDHDWFYRGGAFGLLPGTQPTDSTQTTTNPQSTVLYAKTYNISKHAGGLNADGSYVWPNYAYNMRQYFYFVDHGDPNQRRTATGLDDHDVQMTNFSGSTQFRKDQEIWINDVFGPYNVAEGMRISEVGAIKQGGGACNTSSMVVEVLAATNVCYISNTVRHSTDIPEIDYPQLHSIAVGTSGLYVTGDSDAKIICDQDITLRWDIEGDKIHLSAFNGDLAIASQPFVPGTTTNSTTTMYSQSVNTPSLTVDYTPGTVLFTIPLSEQVEQSTEKPLPSAFDFQKYVIHNADGSTQINLEGIWNEFGFALVFIFCILAFLGIVYIPKGQKE